MKNMIFSLILLYTLISCGKHDMPTPVPLCTTCTDTTKFSLIWQAPISKDTNEYRTLYMPLFYENKVLIGKQFGGPYELLTQRDALKGKQLWTWDDVSSLPDGEYISATNRLVDKIVLTTGNRVYTIDFNNGKLLWKSDIRRMNGYGSYRFSLINNFIYHAHETGSDDQVSLVRSRIEYPQWDTLMTINKQNENGYTPSIESQTLHIAPNGDSLIIFQNRQWNFPTKDGKIDIYAFNLRTRQVAWKIDDIDPEGNSNVAESPTIKDGRFFFSGFKTLYCIDANIGNIIWQRRFDKTGEFVMSSNVLIEDSKVIVKTDYYSLYALDWATGEVIWQQTGSAASPKNMISYKGYIYLSGETGGIYVHRISDGTLVHKYNKPNKSARFPNSNINCKIFIDEEKGNLYCDDHYFFMCLKIPEWK